MGSKEAIRKEPSNLSQRAFTVFTFTPALFLIIYFLDQFHCAVPSALIFLVAERGSYEMRRILFANDERELIPFSIPPLLVVADWIGVVLGREHLALFVFFAMILSVFFLEIFVGEKDDPAFSKSISRVSRSVLLIIYPNSFLMFWPTIMNIGDNGNILFMFMLALVFANDTFCYVFGMLFGKGNRGILKASPNKSVAGYAGGFILTPAIGLTLAKLFPAIGAYFDTTAMVLILSFLTAFAADVGDVIESVFKRCGHVKDSGNIIPGRGGILDCIDSIMTSSALFLFFMRVVTLAHSV